MAPVPLSPVKVGHIDDVQELRNAKPTTIPERFVKGHDREANTSHSSIIN